MKKRKTFTFDSRTVQAVEMASKKLNMTMSNIVEVSIAKLLKEKKYLSKSVKSYLRALSEVIE